MERMKCGQCGIEFDVPGHFYQECQKEGPRKTWYCPNGHPRVFAESQVDKAQREAARLKQKLAEQEDEHRASLAHMEHLKDAANRRASAAKGQVTRLKNRAKAGMCPCCNRHFTNLERHMASKHADFDPNTVENVVPLKAKESL